MFVSYFEDWNKKKINSENPDETAHQEPSHLDVHCLQMYVQIYLMYEVTRLYPTLKNPIYQLSHVQLSGSRIRFFNHYERLRPLIQMRSYVMSYNGTMFWVDAARLINRKGERESAGGMF